MDDQYAEWILSTFNPPFRFEKAHQECVLSCPKEGKLSVGTQLLFPALVFNTIKLEEEKEEEKRGREGKGRGGRRDEGGGDREMRERALILGSRTSQSMKFSVSE